MALGCAAAVWRISMLRFSISPKFPSTTRLPLAFLASAVFHVALFGLFGYQASSGLLFAPRALDVRLSAPAPAFLPKESSTSPVLLSEAPGKDRWLDLAERAAKRGPETPAASAAHPAPPKKPRPERKSESAPAKQAKLPQSTEASPPPDSTAVIALPGLTGRVQRADIQFEIYTGEARQPVGRAQHRYLAPDGDLFGISVQGEPVAGSPGSGWSIEISGRVTRFGLSSFAYQTQGEAADRFFGLARREGRDVSSGAASADAVRTGRLKDNLLDRNSLLYHFMAQPPSMAGGMVWLSDGKVHQQYAYRIEGYETVTLVESGGVRALRLRFDALNGRGSIDLWLLPDQHYLPVRVRFVDRDGEVTEQLAVSLDFRAQ